MKSFLLVIILSLIVACSQSETTQEKAAPIVETQKSKSVDDSLSILVKDTVTITYKPTVVLVPCSNGYSYNLKSFNLNEVLERVMEKDERIELLPFPYVAMNGSGYHGVFDKKYCSEILKNVDADFLIMTEIHGNIFEPLTIPGDTVIKPIKKTKANWDVIP